MLMWHIVLLPLVLGVLVVLHVILVRRHGVVPPFDAVPPGREEVPPGHDALPTRDLTARPVPRDMTGDPSAPARRMP
jgi:ubiquinol-cytochrome c reductase cytochrome b subunit